MRAMLFVTALAGMVASPVLAAGASAPIRAGATSSNSAAALSLGARRGATMGRTSHLDGEGNGSWLIGAVGLVAGVVYAFVQKADDDDEPASP